MVLECHTCVSNLNPPFVLDGAPLLVDFSIHDFNNGRAGFVANSVEQALLLPRALAELYNLKKHEMFLSLKRDLALVRFYFFFLIIILLIDKPQTE